MSQIHTQDSPLAIAKITFFSPGLLTIGTILRNMCATQKQMRKKQVTTEPRRLRVLDDPKHVPQKGSSESNRTSDESNTTINYFDTSSEKGSST